MKINWTSFDYDNKVNTPEPEKLVWVMETGDGVDFGYFDGFTFRMWWGSDDCEVSHWAPIEYPEAPE